MQDNFYVAIQRLVRFSSGVRFSSASRFCTSATSRLSSAALASYSLSFLLPPFFLLPTSFITVLPIPISLHQNQSPSGWLPFFLGNSTHSEKVGPSPKEKKGARAVACCPFCRRRSASAAPLALFCNTQFRPRVRTQPRTFFMWGKCEQKHCKNLIRSTR